MDALFAAIEASGFAVALRGARWGYAAVNAVHILGIALLVGALVPLNLRFLGLWRRLERAPLIQLLVPAAATGLGLAIAAGFLLFSIRAGEYAALGVFQAKLALVATGAAAAICLHWRYGLYLAGAPQRRLAMHGAISLICWLGALTCGRAIAFVIG